MKHGLGVREREALMLLAKLGSRDAVAAAMGTSTHTVTNQLDAAYHKLKVHNAIDAFRVMGWLRPR